MAMVTFNPYITSVAAVVKALSLIINAGTLSAWALTFALVHKKESKQFNLLPSVIAAIFSKNLERSIFNLL